MAQAVLLDDTNYDDDEPNAVSIQQHNNNITIIYLNRPQHKNAVDGITAKKLYKAFKMFDTDVDSRVCILYGCNDVFCGGADLHEVSKIGSNGHSHKAHIVESVDSSNNHSSIGPMGPSRMFLSKPVIAAVSGYAVAGGLELSLLCDLRICDITAVFGVFCRRWGVPLIDGGTVRLPRLIGLSRALDMILTGRAVNAQEALQYGLANRVVEKGQVLNEAINIATLISQFPQQCMNIDRRSAYNSMYNTNNIFNALSYEYESAKHIIQAESIKGATRFSQDKAGRGGDFSLFTNNQQQQITVNNTSNNNNNNVLYVQAQQARQQERATHFSDEQDKLNQQSTTTTMTTYKQPAMKYKGVFFDLGGVIYGSPIHAIIQYERSLGYTKFEINRTMAASKYWSQLECGHISLIEFYDLFDNELKSKNIKGSTREIFRIMSSNLTLRNEMLHTLKCLRQSGYIVVAITNNWRQTNNDIMGEHSSDMRKHFDYVIESCVEHARKPDPHLFTIACNRTQLQPQQCIFLDDIGRNLIGAQKLGFTTIKVNKNYIDALRELQYKLNINGEYNVDFGFGQCHIQPKPSRL